MLCIVVKDLNLYDDRFILLIVEKITSLGYKITDGGRVCILNAVEQIRLAKQKPDQDSLIGSALDKVIDNFSKLINRTKKIEKLEVKIELKKDVILTKTVSEELEIKVNKLPSADQVEEVGVDDNQALPSKQKEKEGEKEETKSVKTSIDSKGSQNPSVFDSKRLNPEDQIINKILGEFSKYKSERMGNRSDKKKKYYWCGIFSRSSLAFSIDEKFESIWIMSMILIGEETKFSTKRQIKALFSGDLGKICCNPEYRPVIERYINKAQLSKAREETIAAIL